jgi:lipoate-protein ligase A
MERWRLLSADGVEAAAGLALDEALLSGYARDADPAWPPTLRLYTYRSHCALVGRYQHLEAEVDLDACRRTGTGFSRRPTGGGAIVMGEGQLGVAVATRAPAGDHPRQLLGRYAEGIVAGLAELGIHATFAGKNDLSAAGRKIAGLGLYLDPGGGLLFHSSVLADLDVAFMLSVLRIPAAKLGDKGIAAVEERITTVTRETGEPWSGARLRDVVASGFAKALDLDLEPGTTTPGEDASAGRLEAERYGADAWRFEQTPQPEATATSVLKTPEGLVRCYLALHGPTIKSALFAGDFNAVPEPLARFEASLRWARLEDAALQRLAEAACPEGTGLGVPPSALVRAVLEAGERAAAPAAPVRPSGSCYFPEGAGVSPEEAGGPGVSPEELGGPGVSADQPEVS